MAELNTLRSLSSSPGLGMIAVLTDDDRELFLAGPVVDEKIEKAHTNGAG